MAVDAEYERIAAKQLFTRSKWALLNSITDNEGFCVVENRFQDLKARWINVQYKNDVYLSKILDENKTASNELEQWIDDLEIEFTNSKREKIKYIHKEHIEREHIPGKLKLPRNEILRHNQEASEKKRIEQFKKLRGLEEYNFIIAVENLNELFSMDGVVITVERMEQARKEIKEQYAKWKSAQNDYICLLHLDDANMEFDWVKVIQKLYAHTNRKISEYLHAKRNGLPVPLSCKVNSTDFIWLDRNRLPSFKGDIHAYPRFKTAFKKNVLPIMNYNYSAAYVLKCCLKGEPREVVKDIDDIEEMWKMLDVRYGLWEFVIDDFRSFQSTPKTNHNEDTNGNGYGNLKRINKLKVRYPKSTP